MIIAVASCPLISIAADPGMTAAERKAYEQHALTNRGDVKRGAKLFAEVKRTRCETCHRVAGKGGEVGPDLSRIGGKFDRPHLIESLLEPSRQIVEGYRTSLVLTTDGRVLNGVVKQESERSLTLHDAEGKPNVIGRDDIESLRTSEVSLMTDNLASSLSKQEFTDLVAYLETLRSGANKKFGAGVRGPISVPEAFQVQTIATGLTGAVALETLDDGRILVCEQTGTLRVIKNDQLLTEPMLSLSVDSNWERGLIGVTVHPEFPASPWVYVCYVAANPYPHHRISRFRVTADTADPKSEQILLRGDDQTKMGGNVPAGHQGGAIHFGNDGHLYIAIGEQTAGIPAQKLDTFLGKILRVTDSGEMPKDNPFLNQTKDKYRAIWAIGCRNPFTFAIRPTDGMMLINDVGGKFEEINPGVAGANYGWPNVNHGMTQQPGIKGPINVYPQASISGGDFAPTTLPGKHSGRYFFADFVHGWIRTIDPANGKQADAFASGLRRPVDMRFSRDGSLYVLLRNAWVKDDKFVSDTGSLLKISRRSPQTLSE
ncbi:MAG: PQQ-dependent sugar dehydrogenase [Planctomycetota bacterium]